MQTLRRGLVAGLLTGLVLAMLDFVTDGTPGRLLPEALHWFGITIADPTISRFAGFFSLIAHSISPVWFTRSPVEGVPPIEPCALTADPSLP